MIIELTLTSKCQTLVTVPDSFKWRKLLKLCSDLKLGRTVPNVELIPDFLKKKYAMLYLNFMIPCKRVIVHNKIFTHFHFLKNDSIFHFYIPHGDF